MSTSGIAVVDTETMKLKTTMAVLGGTDGLMKALNSIGSNIDTVIYEAFDDRSTVADTSVKEIIGAIKQRYPNAIEQRNTGYKKIATNEMLKALCWYQHGGHHDDVLSAIRHILYYIIKTDKNKNIQIARNVMGYLYWKDK
jgi:hypothetical protein